jgi:hypothetical protein
MAVLNPDKEVAAVAATEEPWKSRQNQLMVPVGALVLFVLSRLCSNVISFAYLSVHRPPIGGTSGRSACPVTLRS